MVNRRNFIGAMSVALAGAGSAWGKTPCPASGSGPLRFAGVGVGGMGEFTCDAIVAAGGRIVALCDTNADELRRAAARWPGCPCFTDYRDMLAKAGRDFDAVAISTPDHTHAYVALDCMSMGKHVYVQKPLAHSLAECELLRAAAERTGVVTQMGNQGHPGVARYAALKAVDAWGEVKEIESWSDRPCWPQGMKEYPAPGPLPRRFSERAWNCWCGPAPDHGYSPRFEAFVWRGWWDYGCGAIGDMAVHNADPAFWTFGLGLPVEVDGDTCGEGPCTLAYPKKSVIRMAFANGMKFTWYDGGLQPRVPQGAAAGFSFEDNGLLVHGSKLTTCAGSHAGPPVVVAVAGRTWDKVARREQSAMAKLVKSVKPVNHYREWVDACKRGDPEACGSKFSYAATLTEALLVGCVSLRFPGRKLAFDPERKVFADCPEANAFLRAPERGEWRFARADRPAWKGLFGSRSGRGAT